MVKKIEYVTVKEFNQFKKDLSKNEKALDKCLKRVLKKLDDVFKSKPEKLAKKKKKK